MKLKPIDTANARPIQAGSVRRWRIVNRPMSIGPLSTPPIARPSGDERDPDVAAVVAPAPTSRSRSATAIPRHRQDEQVPLAAAAVEPAGDQRGDHAGDAGRGEHEPDRRTSGRRGAAR